MGLYDRDYMRDRPQVPEYWTPPRTAVRRAPLRLHDVADGLGSLVGLLGVVAITVLLFSGVVWLLTGGSSAGPFLGRTEAPWGAIWLVAATVSVVVGSLEPDGWPRGVSVGVGLIAAIAGYAWAMGRLGFDAAQIAFHHDLSRDRGGGIPVFEGLVAATPWWLLLGVIVLGGATQAIDDRSRVSGWRGLGLGMAIPAAAYAAAKLLTEEFGVELFH